MNAIKGKVCIGSPCSDARFNVALTENGIPVCGDCIKSHKYQISGKQTIMPMGMDECYVCEEGKDETYLFLT